MTTPTWLVANLTTPCTIHPRVATGTDEYNDPVYTELPPVDELCFIQPVSQVEIQDGRAEVGQFSVHFGASTVGLFDGFARIEVSGLSYEVIGPPAYYPSLTQPGVHHVEVIVERSTA